jgi:hypothetical protein
MHTAMLRQLANIQEAQSRFAASLAESSEDLSG